MELKPCPFCGGKANVALAFKGEDKNGVPFWYAYCLKCDVSIGRRIKSNAIKAWNIRSEK
jgi:Lar family restriction alleviation protein